MGSFLSCRSPRRVRGVLAALAFVAAGVVGAVPVAQADTNLSTTTEVVTSPNPPTIGNDVTFTATVRTTPEGQGNPTGDVRFVVDGGSFIDRSLDGNGQSSANLNDFAGYATGFAAGIHTVQVFYLGATGFNTSNSGAPAVERSTQWDVGFATTTSVMSSANPSNPGEAVTFTATVCSPPAVAAPTGSVQFATDGADFGSPVTVGSAAPNNCTAFVSSSTSTLSIAGSPHSVSAAYAPAPGFAPSSGLLAGGQLVTEATPPTVACSASPLQSKSNNHKLVGIVTTVTVADSGSGPATFTLVSVTSNQADSGLGHGDDVANDIQGWTIGTADTTGLLRQERYGSDRVYTLTYRGSDLAGNTTTCETKVTVRK